MIIIEHILTPTFLFPCPSKVKYLVSVPEHTSEQPRVFRNKDSRTDKNKN